VVVAHAPPGRSLERWSAGPLRENREQGVSVAVENMPKSEIRGIISLGRYLSCHLPEHLVGLGDVTLDTSHVGAGKVDLMRAYSVLAGQLRHVHLSDSDLTGADSRRPRTERLPRRRQPGAQALASGRPGTRDHPKADARGARVRPQGAWRSSQMVSSPGRSQTEW
jgi:hypothetical protein